MLRGIRAIGEGPLGEELCGRIVEVGSEVTAVAVGDRVVGLAFGTFGPQAVTREELVAQAPAAIPVAALATIPTAFVTASLAFDLAELRAGERVLVHTGAGGVGLAAIQLAQAAGAAVFATASAPKQAFLRSLGVSRVCDSRSTAFGQEILEATGGTGVDVVLNSLTGEGFIAASLSCLAPGGRFVELSRRDILSREEMAAVRPDVAYSILELDVVKQDDPARAGAALQQVMARLAAGELTPLVHSLWPLAESGAAMGFMRDARHIGKIVLTAPPLASGELRRDRTYLVTGGLGGIGCAVAGWLVERGAGVIVLNGRRAPDAAAEETIATLRDRGATVQVELADVTDAAALDAMLARMDRELPPLAGVIHSVGVLADAALGNQSWERFEQVLWPKVLGAWHLHRATAARDLDLFVLFSSVAGVLGNPGQANHAAANAFLDQLAAHRRALGLPGQTIAWGAWAGLGEAEEQRERIEGRRAASGAGWISVEQGLRAFDRLLRADSTPAVVMAVDWPQFAEVLDGRPPLLEDLLAAGCRSWDGQCRGARRSAVPPAQRSRGGAHGSGGVLPAARGAVGAQVAIAAGPHGGVLRARHGLADGGGTAQSSWSGVCRGVRGTQYRGVRLPGHRCAGRSPRRRARRARRRGRARRRSPSRAPRRRRRRPLPGSAWVTASRSSAWHAVSQALPIWRPSGASSKPVWTQ